MLINYYHLNKKKLVKTKMISLFCFLLHNKAEIRMNKKSYLSIKFFLILFTGLLFITDLRAQNVGVNDDGTSPDVSAILDAKSSSKGFLVPRFTYAQMTGGSIPTPATGLLIYVTTVLPGFY